MVQLGCVVQTSKIKQEGGIMWKVSLVKISLVILSFLLLFEISISQSLFDKLNADVKTFAKNSANYFSAPSGFNKEDFFRLSAISAGTILLFSLDHLNKDFQRFDNKIFKTAMEIDRYYGTVWMWGLISGSLYSSGMLFRDDEIRELGLMVFEAGALSGFVTTLLKVAFGRERPYVSGDKFKFHPFSFGGNKFYSFPSGHATLSFAISTVIASKFESKFVKFFIYTPAVLTALARVYNNQHWFSDVFLGSSIGYFTAAYIVNAHRENQR